MYTVYIHSTFGGVSTDVHDSRDSKGVLNVLIFSERELASVVCLSVTLVRPSQPVETFRPVFLRHLVP